MPPTHRHLPLLRRAFTLIELLTAIAIIAILVSILIPAIGKIRKSPLQTQSLSNLRSLAQATHLYTLEHSNKLPVIRINWSSGYWTEALTDYISPEISGGGWSPLNFKQSPTYVDPLAKNHHSKSDYGANDQLLIVGALDNGLPASDIPNPSGTALFMQAKERDQDKGSWYVNASLFVASPNSTSPLASIPSDHGKGSILLVFADGHAKSIPMHEFRQNSADYLLRLPPTP